ncbi:MAG: CRISPR system precrRNA processing endoribonuclease RAMP protein Cas6 [Gammaproteobacteria bacterium]
MGITLPLGRYRFAFRAVDELRLPRFPGSAWRGVFGHALKRAVCVTGLPTCPDCLLYRSCAYPYVFETPPPPGTQKMRKYPAAPHPFVLDLEEDGGATPVGASHTLGLTLIGRGNAYLPPIVFALTQAGEQGLGSRRARLALESIAQETALSGEWRNIHRTGGGLNALPPFVPQTPAVPESLRINFRTPLRIKRDDRPASAEDLTFGMFFSNLLRRISLLSYFHSDTQLEADFAGLTASAREVSLTDAALFWRDGARYSSRQSRETPMGGLLGEIALAGAGLDPFWPYLWLGQYVHAGAATSMGLGRYAISSASLPGGTQAAGRGIMEGCESRPME